MRFGKAAQTDMARTFVATRLMTNGRSPGIIQRQYVPTICITKKRDRAGAVPGSSYSSQVNLSKDVEIPWTLYKLASRCC